MPRLAPLVFTLAACGRVAFEPGAVAGDAGDPDAMPVSATGCWPSWHAHAPTVAPPVLVAELATAAAETNPSLHADGRTLYFNRAVPNRARDLFFATRTDRGQAFGAATSIDSLNTAFDEARMTLTEDGLVAVYTSGRDSAGINLWMSIRSATTEQFPAPTQTLLGAVNTPNNDTDPQLSPDGLRLYFSPSNPDPQRLVVASRTARDAAFGPGIDVAGIDQASTPADPTLSPDELVIVFSYATVNAQTNDLYYATRSSITEPFGTAAPVPGVNASDPVVDDADASLSADGCELFFVSNRLDGLEMYVSAVAPP